MRVDAFVLLACVSMSIAMELSAPGAGKKAVQNAGADRVTLDEATKEARRQKLTNFIEGMKAKLTCAVSSCACELVACKKDEACRAALGALKGDLADGVPPECMPGDCECMQTKVQAAENDALTSVGKCFLDSGCMKCQERTAEEKQEIVETMEQLKGAINGKGGKGPWAKIRQISQATKDHFATKLQCTFDNCGDAVCACTKDQGCKDHFGQLRQDVGAMVEESQESRADKKARRKAQALDDDLKSGGEEAAAAKKAKKAGMPPTNEETLAARLHARTQVKAAQLAALKTLTCDHMKDQAEKTDNANVKAVYSCLAGSECNECSE